MREARIAPGRNTRRPGPSLVEGLFSSGQPMKQTAVAVRMWREGMFTCHLSTEGYPHLRVSANKQVIVEEVVTTWLQACERAMELQDVAKRTLGKMAG